MAGEDDICDGSAAVCGAGDSDGLRRCGMTGRNCILAPEAAGAEDPEAVA